MKRIPLFIITLFFISQCFAQDVVERKNKLTNLVNEKYQTIIQTHKQIKQGLYHAFYNKNTVIASGNYTNDQKTGMWHFYDQRGKLMQNFNYDTNRLQYEAPEDSTSNIMYRLDEFIRDTDRVTKPIRLGGRYYGYVPYLRAFKLPEDFKNSSWGEFTVMLEILVSPLGRLADCTAHIRYARSDKDLAVISINPDLLSDDDKQFIPATLNRQPVSSRILIGCYITRLDGIDIY
ncbi:MAG TPA: hypothetical protein VL490_03645 [Mucilaginibacter sp.]|nr:hypothetical protein [Mucilaginibacter sp.]